MILMLNNFWLIFFFLFRANWASNYEKDWHKMFQMPTDQVKFEKERIWNLTPKFDFTCKSLFDSNVVGTCRISFSHSEYILLCGKMAHWHCQTWCHENRISKRQERTPFWHRKIYANEITCELLAQHATREKWGLRWRMGKRHHKKEWVRPKVANRMERTTFIPLVKLNQNICLGKCSFNLFLLFFFSTLSISSKMC